MQQPDTNPGEYYVTAIDGARSVKLLGPFTNDHAKALSMVDAVRDYAVTIDPRAHWYSFGTARVQGGDVVPIRAGTLNKHFGLPYLGQEYNERVNQRKAIKQPG